MDNKRFDRIFFKWRFVIATLLAAVMLFAGGCSKTGSNQATENLLQQYFEQNVLNRDFIVSNANDNGTDLTAQYNGYVFRLMKNTYFDGPMTAAKNGVTYTGTWTSNDDYGKLVINITQPSIPAGFTFINREWRFTKKAFPVMELAPWGSTDAKVLHMQRL
ncbi:MAG: hypothetical protein JWQ27_1976 [Ferruginibacter sp.]|nr:hypothetical protein [Ferruginibacter sp.]